jgi:hypothetical protein
MSYWNSIISTKVCYSHLNIKIELDILELNLKNDICTTLLSQQKFQILLSMYTYGVNIIHNSGSQKYHSLMKYTQAVLFWIHILLGAWSCVTDLGHVHNFFPYCNVVILRYDSSLTISFAPSLNMTATFLGMATWRAVFCDASTRAGSASWRTQGRDL